MFRSLSSWGRYPYFPQTGHPVYWRDLLPEALSRVCTDFGVTLAYGNGRSYGDSCLSASDHVIQTRTLDRIILADWREGVLRAESGVTLQQILSLSIPQGWFLPVVPGTQFVTLGGAVANDIHGKNHHVRGTFGAHVRRFGLVRSDRSALECSVTENPDLYRATIGGLGLTGLIDWVEVQLVPIKSDRMNVSVTRYDALREFFALSKELDDSNEYAVSWIDCLARGRSAGRGIYTVGNHDPEPSRVASPNRRALRMPITPPVSLVNGASLKAFNAVYFRSHRRGSLHRKVHYAPFFFPLDRIMEWNRLYGIRGFQQFQSVVPENNAEAATGEMLSAIARSGRGSFLAVIKRCGAIPSPGLLSFPLPGVSLALDFPEHTELTRSLFPRLDSIVRAAEGRLYPAKDAHMSGADFRSAYPAWVRVEALRDPGLNSRFWQRVTAE